jgi:hypothetical protein
MAFLSWIQQPKSLAKALRESIDHHLRMTTQTRQLLQETRNMRPVNQGVVSLNGNRQHLLAILQEAAASADHRNEP